LTPAIAMQSMSPDHDLREHAKRLRASGVLGRAPIMGRLFDYLVKCAAQGKVPKETEVALDVFGRDHHFDPAQDAIVRVYVCKLRKKLDEFYAGIGAAEKARLVLPKGCYGLGMEHHSEAAMAVASIASDEAAPAVMPHRCRWILAALGVSLLVNILAALAFVNHAGGSDQYYQVRQHSLWSRLLADGKPITIVVGDYFIFGEQDPESHTLKRLVREFSINSRDALARYLQDRPDLQSRFTDVDLTYLPVASAFAMREIMPILSEARYLRVVTASELTPELLKSSHIVYVGYLSGLGMLEELVFSGSRFSIGETYDELIDRKTQLHYVSQYSSRMAGRIAANEGYRDYGYLAAFAGPSGNQFVVIAGTRDAALTHVAETLTISSKLDELRRHVGASGSLEALYEVGGMDRVSIDGRLVQASARYTAAWTEHLSARR
jgi:hypothetical protein